MTTPAEGQGPVERLLAPLTDDQTQLLTLIAKVLDDKRVWPIWQYVDEYMARRGIDAAQVISTLPSISGMGPQPPRYTLVSYGGALPPGDDQRIHLTVAGLAHIDFLSDIVTMFLRSLTVLANGRARTSFDPDKVTEIVVPESDLINALRDSQRWLSLLPDLVRGEPGVWLTQYMPGNETFVEDDPRRYPSWRPGKFLDWFVSCASIEDYLGRLVAVMRPPAPSAPMTAPSPLNLASALDYLDVVWRLKFGQSLVVLPGAEKTTRLAFDAATAEEFDNRMSALGDTLKGFKTTGLPGTNGGHPVTRAIDVLTRNCPGIDTERLDHAHTILKAAVDLRNGLQHHGDTRQDIVSALATYGLRFPVLNHTVAWKVIAAAVVEALGAVREALHATLHST
ncbi:MAG: hypothetical protein QG608_2655 [Actinomycetota bacterium]|nr:hypothetical protein [Actinomycetota bacterium]